MEQSSVIKSVQSELSMLIEQNSSLVAQQKQMGEFLANFKIYLDELQKENVALLEENKRLKGIAFDNLPLKPIGPCRGTAYGNPSDDEDFDEDSDIWGEDDDNDDDEAINNYLSNETTCWGCKENQPNQLAHMDKGGCLYFANTDDEDSEEEREQYAVNTLMDEMDIGDDGDVDDDEN